jgi:hypothetical protein
MSGILRDALKARSADFNRRAQQALRSRPSLEMDVFAELLKEGLAPLIEAIDTQAPERRHAAIEAGYDLALEIAALGLGRSGFAPSLIRLWKILPAQIAFLAPAFRSGLAALGNALLFLRGQEGVRVGEWLDRLERLPAQGAALRDAALVLSWRCGVAAWRLPALEAAARLSAESFRICTDLEGFPACLESLRMDPWWDPHRPPGPRVAGWIGDFLGNDGPFREPPGVRVAGDRLVVAGGKHPLELHADRFGMMLIPHSEPSPPDADRKAAPIACAWLGNTLSVPSGRIEPGFPARGMAAVGVNGVVAVYSPFSFRIAVVTP